MYSLRSVVSALFLFTALLHFGPETISAQNLYFPPADQNWETRSADDLGLNASLIREAVELAESSENSVDRDLRIAILQGFSREPYHGLAGPVKERGGPAGMIVKDGYIVATWGDPERVDMTFSVTKSYLSTVAGLAWDKGLIRDLDHPVRKYVWDSTFDGEHNSSITWSHLLNQTSDWYGSLFGIDDWADRPSRQGDIDSWRMRELNEPGTFFKYNDVRVNLLAYSLLHVVREPLPVILKKEVMDPIGAGTTWRWFGYDNARVLIDGIEMQSVSGGGHHGGGMFINTYDQARFGLLFARRGSWEGTQLISEEWIDLVQSPSEPNPSYGYMWWTLRGNTQWEGVPDHVYYAAGFGGNYILVDEENDLVIVTRWLDSSVLEEFAGTIYRALR